MLLAALDSAGLPAVGGVDILLVTIAVNQPRQAYLAAFCAVVGSLIGSTVLFGIARRGGEVFLGRYIMTRSGARLHSWFERYGLVTVFIPALSPVPMPMKIPVFCAGALGVRWPIFLSVITAARIIRYFALAYIGMQYGSLTFHFLRSHWIVVLAIALALATITVLILRLVKRTGSVSAESAIGFE